MELQTAPLYEIISHTEVMLCTRCSGTGRVYLEKYTYLSVLSSVSVCTACLGTGRVRKTTTVTFAPYTEIE